MKSGCNAALCLNMQESYFPLLLEKEKGPIFTIGSFSLTNFSPKKTQAVNSNI